MRKLIHRPLIAGLAFFALAAVGCSDTSLPTSMGDALDFSVESGNRMDLTGPTIDHGIHFDIESQLLAAFDKGSSLHAVRRKKPLTKDVAETKTITPAKGGTIKVDKAGMKLVIPPGALPGSADIDITIVAYAGKFHLYEFLPHGIQFNAPVTVEFDIANVEKFAKELDKRLKKLEKEQAKCDKRAAQGKELKDKCLELADLWAELEDDEAWYSAAIEAEGIIGVYFEGEVKSHGRRSPKLNVLEIFNVTVDGTDLEFDIDHFSGYALAM